MSPLIRRDVAPDDPGSPDADGHAGLSEGERRYRLLAECAGDLVLRIASDGVIVHVEPQDGGFGHGRAGLIGMSLGDLLGAGAAGAPVPDGLLRGRLRRGDGGMEDFDARVRTLRDDDGRVIERQAVIRSGEARRRRDTELAAARARYEVLARHIPGAAIFLFDTERRYLLVEGDADPELTNGVDPVGRTPAEVFPAGVAGYVETLYDEALAGAERSFRRESASGRVYDITLSPVRAGGEVVGGMSLLIDVTESAHREAEQAALREISDAVFQGASPDAVFGLVVERVAEIFGAVGAAILRFGCEEDAVVLASAPVGPAEFLPEARVPLREVSAVGRVAHTGRPVVVARYPDAGDHDPLAEALRRLGAVGGAAAPISIRQGLWGALGIGGADPQRLTEETAMRLTRFAELVAVDIGNVEAWHALARDASTDLLTGLPNRRTFVERLGAEIARGRRFGHPLALVLFDIDHFKAVNDTHGHLVGDRVLAALARVVGEEARGEEMIARIGGEEFAMILPETAAAGALAAAERLRLAVADARLGEVGVTISLGVDEMRPGDEPDDLVFRADQALYRAKARGRNMTCRWPADGGEAIASGGGAGI